MDFQKALKELQPDHDFFVGIDSDGCVFDTMEVKQKEFFIPNALKYFDLLPVSKALRNTWEFVNLYSVHRGGNRFISLVRVFDMLNGNDSVKESGIILPSTDALKVWIKKENKLSNENLRKYYEKNPDPDLEKILTWSEAVNEDIGRWLKKIPPFPPARKAIGTIFNLADIVIVSQTPIEAVEREWKENDLEKYVKLIAAQEHGTKTEHLSLAAKGKYPDNRILMIGDAKGDLDAAENNDVLFYPIVPGHEIELWERFMEKGFRKFLDGSYKGSYADSLKEEFIRSLPESPLM